jgi:hypothetical protein
MVLYPSGSWLAPRSLDTCSWIGGVDGVDAEPREMRDLFDEAEVGARPANARGRMRREAFDVHLVDDELLEWDAGRAVPLPVEPIVHHDALRHHAGVVPRVQREIPEDPDRRQYRRRSVFQKALVDPAGLCVTAALALINAAPVCRATAFSRAQACQMNSSTIESMMSVKPPS